MLKKRIITAAIILPLLIAAILAANPWVLLGLLVLTLGLAAREWFGLIPLTLKRHQLAYLALMVIGTLICDLAFQYVLFACFILWAFIIAAICMYPKSEKAWGYPWVVMLVGIFLLPLAGYAAAGIYLMPKGQWLLLYVLALVACSDTGAYFSGKRLGKHKLIEKVSSGKTIEGAVGGLILPFILAALTARYFAPKHMVSWYVLSMFTVVISMFGDLFISMLKRRVKLKDTGNVLPGHGGVLDRLDSMIAALPFFFAGFYYFCLDVPYV